MVIVNAHTYLPRIFYRTVKPVRTPYYMDTLYLPEEWLSFFFSYFLQNEPVWRGHFREEDIYNDLAVVH